MAGPAKIKMGPNRFRTHGVRQLLDHCNHKREDDWRAIAPDTNIGID
jgi:hypothetical protein